MTDNEGDGPITFEAALEVIAALAEEHLAATGRPIRSIVALGGAAMAALALRERSDDVDLYVTDIDDAVLDTVTRRFKDRFGLAFKIDATPSKQLWGAIVIEDVDAAPIVKSIKCRQHDVVVRALSAETMYIVKAAADRPKDQSDIEALARRTTYEDTLPRAKRLFPWYADRGAFPEQVERLARYMARDFSKTLADVDADFGLPEVVATKVRAIRDAMSMRFMQTLKGHMRKRPDLLTFDPKQPNLVRFDAEAAGVTDEILALTRTNAKSVSDMAANTLKECDPARHMARMLAIGNEKKGQG